MSVRTVDNSAAAIARLRAALQVGIRAGAMVIENSAKEYCPVDTGTLRRSIHTEVQEGLNPDRTVALVGTEVEYGPYVEFGTRKMRAQPYLRPAVDHRGREAVEVVRSFIKEAL